ERRGQGSYVTTRVQPLAGNEMLQGLDAATQPDNLAAIRTSRDSNAVAMSAPFPLVQQATAVANFARLHASGKPPGRCSINLSAASLEDEGLVDHVVSLVRANAVEPGRLCFELTE